MIKAIIILAILATAAHARPREFSIGLAEQQTKGLVAYYPMLVSGTDVLDRSGNGNNGSAVNAPTFSYANGYVGDGVRFNGIDQRIVAPALNFTTAVTVAAWVRPSAASGVILAKRDDIRYSFDLSTGATLIAFWGVNDNNNRPTAQLTLNQWQHVVCTYDSEAGANNIKIYVNGSLIASDTKTGNINTNAVPVTIGRRSMTAPNEGFYEGDQDEVRIWNRALSAAEIKQRWRDDTTINRGR